MNFEEFKKNLLEELAPYLLGEPIEIREQCYHYAVFTKIRKNLIFRDFFSHIVLEKVTTMAYNKKEFTYDVVKSSYYPCNYSRGSYSITCLCLYCV